MASPIYTPVTNFADDERNNAGGRSTVRTAQLDAELAAVEVALNGIGTNLNKIQRDDGKLLDKVIYSYNFSSEALAVINTTWNPRGQWVTATAYEVSDLVEEAGNAYVVSEAHTSGVFATDYAAGKLQIFITSSGISTNMQQVVQATTMAEARELLGSETTGDALFTSELPADARTILSVLSATEIDTLIDAINIKQIQHIAATVAANALTITLNPTTLAFRSTTLNDGAITLVELASPITVVVPDTATLGTTSAIAAKLQVYAINNAGTIELAVVFLSAGNQINEANLLTTVAISPSADSANVVYSTNLRTSVAHRSVGYIEITEAAAGVWATAPTLVQGAGGVNNRPPVQTMQNLTGSRAYATTYTNNTMSMIYVWVTGTLATNTQTLTATVNGVTVGVSSSFDGTGGTFRPHVSFVVPIGGTYAVTATGGALTIWTELR